MKAEQHQGPLIGLHYLAAGKSEFARPTVKHTGRVLAAVNPDLYLVEIQQPDEAPEQRLVELRTLKNYTFFPDADRLADAEKVIEDRAFNRTSHRPVPTR